MNISVIVPSYNQGDYIAATLDSLLNVQGERPVEVIVNDGGSTDQTIEVLKSYEDKIRWGSAPDFGQTDAINKGLQVAGGDILAYLNSDDVYMPGAVESVVRHFTDHPDCDLLYGDAWHLHADGTFMEEYPTAEWNYDQLFERCYLCQPAVFWRRKIHQKVGYFDERLDLTMDYEFWLRAGRSVKVDYLGGLVLAGSRLHADTKTLRQRVPAHREMLLVVRRYARKAADCYTWLKHTSSLLAIEQGFSPSASPDEQRLHALSFCRNVLLLAEEYRIELSSSILTELVDHINGCTRP